MLVNIYLLTHACGYMILICFDVFVICAASYSGGKCNLGST